MALSPRIGGNQASFTYAAGTGDTTLVFDNVFEAFQWEGRIGFLVSETTPFGYSGVRRDVFMQDAQGTLSFLAASGKVSPIPTGIVGTLTLTEYPGNSRTFKALLVSIHLGPKSQGGDVQRFEYQWMMSAQAAGAPIT